MIVLLMMLLPSSAAMQMESGNSSDWMPAPFWQNNDTIYKCEGDHVTFNWELDPTASQRPGKKLKKIVFSTILANKRKTMFGDGSGDKLATIHVYPLPNVLTAWDRYWALRVAASQETYKMSINEMTVGDSGRYSMEVNWENFSTGALESISSTINLVVADRLMSVNHEIKISKSEYPYFDATTGKHHIVLECGVFTHTTRPPFDVIWELPGQGRASSTGWRDGRFYLILALPVQTGSYKCVLKDYRYQLKPACLRYSEESYPLRIDGIDARFWLLEQDLDRTRNMTRANKANPSVQTSEVVDLQDRVASLVEQVADLKEKSSNSQAFLATGLTDNTVAKGETLKFKTIKFGTGYAMPPKSNTGEIKAMYSGVYLVTFTMRATVLPNAGNGTGGGSFGVNLIRDGAVYLSSGATVDNRGDYDSVTLTAAVKMAAGETLSLQAQGDQMYVSSSSQRVQGTPMLSVVLLKSM